MIRATRVLGQHRWTEQATDTVVLDFDDRHRRRMTMTGTRGLEFLLDLENAIALRGGDALVLEDGRLIEVVAAAEPLGDPVLVWRAAERLVRWRGWRSPPAPAVGDREVRVCERGARVPRSLRRPRSARRRSLGHRPGRARTSGAGRG